MTQSFDDLDLPAEMTEALSAEGFEEPTEFQRAAIWVTSMPRPARRAISSALRLST